MMKGIVFRCTRFWACQLGFVVKAYSLHSLQRQSLGMLENLLKQELFVRRLDEIQVVASLLCCPVEVIRVHSCA